MCAQFREEDTVRAHVKDLTYVPTDDTQGPSLIHWCHSIIEGHWDGQAGFAFLEAIQAVPNHLPVPPVHWYNF